MTAFINTPAFKALIGLVIFYIGLKTFAGGVKSMGNSEDLQSFITNPYWMFVGGIVCTLLWQSSSTTTIVALVSSGVLPLPSATIKSSLCPQEPLQIGVSAKGFNQSVVLK